MLANIGSEVRVDDSGILTTVLYQKNQDSKPVYAFEGSIETGGAIVNWARDKMSRSIHYGY